MCQPPLDGILACLVLAEDLWLLVSSQVKCHKVMDNVRVKCGIYPKLVRVYGGQQQPDCETLHSPWDRWTEWQRNQQQSHKYIHLEGNTCLTGKLFEGTDFHGNSILTSLGDDTHSQLPGGERMGVIEQKPKLQSSHLLTEVHSFTDIVDL